MPPQNNCTPSTVYGPFEQTLFLGCSVLNFTANAGWNEQASDVTIDLVQDPCSATKTYIPTNLGVFNPATATLADPGFTDPNIGAPAYFRVAGFEYAGIIQSYSRKDGPDGNPIYNVKLTDPRVVLDHTQIILDEYEGSVGSMHNIVNVYGYLESQTSDCPPTVVDGVMFGAPAGGFGNSDRTERGIPWNNVKCALQSLLGDDTQSVPGTYGMGGIYYRGGNANGYGEIAALPYAKYILDISEIPFSSTDYRLSGPTMSVSELISEICEAAGCDYYVELLPTAWESDTSTTALVIKVRVLVRTAQPSIGTISSFITSHSTAGGGNGVITDSIGAELRTDTNNSFVIGGKVRSVYEVEKPFYNPYDTDAIIPFWGWDNDGSPIQSRYDKTGCWQGGTEYEGQEVGKWTGPLDWEVRLDVRKINAALNLELSDSALGIGSGRNPVSNAVPGLDSEGFAWVWEGEIRAALGDFENFCNFIVNEECACTYFSPPLIPGAAACTTAPRLLNKSVLKSYFDELEINATWSKRPNRNLFPAGFAQHQINIVPGNPGTKANPEDPRLRDAKTIYEFMNSFAQEYYGKQWLVPIPFACFDRDSDTNQLTWSDLPSTEGGWSEQSNIIGLASPSFAKDFFSDDSDGKVEPILRWEQNERYVIGRYDVRPYPTDPETHTVDPGWAAPLYAPMSPPLTGIDASDLDPSTYLTNITGQVGTTGKQPYGYLWSKADIHPSWVTGAILYDGEVDDGAWALMKMPSPVVTGYGILDVAAEQGVIIVQSGTNDRLIGGVADISKVLGGQPAGYFAKRALPPTAAAVPVLSNTQTYGPWYAFASTYGGSGVPGSVSAEVDEGLTPWEYGGSGYMRLAGLSQVSDSITAMQYGERGEVTVPGYPTGGLGGALDGRISIYSGRMLKTGTCGGFPYNYVYGEGLVSSSSPATVSNINVTVSPQGVTTSYTISTFTPVFGRFAQSNAERLKRIGQNKLQQNRQRRALGSRLQRTLLNKVSRVNDNKRNNVGNSAFSPRSSSVLFAGKPLTEDPKRKVVIAPDAKSLALYDDYDITSMMSMDGLMRPVSKTGGVSGNLPAMKAGAGDYCEPDGYATHPNRHLSVAPPPPVSGISPIIVAANYLDPLADPVSNANFCISYQATGTFNTGTIVSVTGTGNPCVSPSGSGFGPASGFSAISGHDWESVARSTLAGLSGMNATGGDGLTGTYSMMIAGNDRKYTEDYRFLALRAPLVLQGWGYDTYGKPIPNAKGWPGDSTFTSGDTPADSGSVHQTGHGGLTDRFAPNWLADATNWPVAPVDLRYDRQREVWTVPPPFRMYQVEATGDIAAGEVGKAYVLNVDDLFDQDGNTPPVPTWTTCSTDASGLPATGADGSCTGLICNSGTYPVIDLNNWTDSSLSSGSKTTAYYDTSSCTYWPLAGGGGGGGDYEYWVVSDVTGVVSGTGYWRDHNVYNKGNVSFSGCSGTTVEINHNGGHDQLGRPRNVVSICASSSAGGYGGDVNFVNGISCSGANIIATSGTMHFSDGLLKGVDTP